jgi:hypothetical protein
MQPLTALARPQVNRTLTQFDFKLDSAFQRAKFTHGLNQEEHHEALSELAQPLKAIFDSHSSQLVKINANGALSDQGKREKKAEVLEVSLLKIDEYRKKNDKTDMVKDLSNRQSQKVKEVRTRFQPSSDVVKYFQSVEIRNHFAEVEREHERSAKIVGGNIENKTASNPVGDFLKEVASGYDPENLDQCRQAESVLYAMLDSAPYPLKTVSDSIRDEVNIVLQNRLAPIETKQLAEVKGFSRFIQELSTSTQTLIQEAR